MCRHLQDLPLTTVQRVTLVGMVWWAARHRSAQVTVRRVGTRRLLQQPVPLPTTALRVTLVGTVLLAARHRSAQATAHWVGTRRPQRQLDQQPMIALRARLASTQLLGRPHAHSALQARRILTRTLHLRVTAAAVATTHLLPRPRAPSVPVVWLTQIRLPALRALHVDLACIQPADKSLAMHVLQGQQMMIQMRPHHAKLAWSATSPPPRLSAVLIVPQDITT
jgi:hypothetical protein